MVTVYTSDGLSNPANVPIFVHGTYSNNGGLSWINFNLPGNLVDPTLAPTAPQLPLPNATDATVAFDRNNNG